MNYFTYASKPFADGRIAEVTPLVFGRARITTTRDFLYVEDGW